jgi:hypothetical protein
VRPRTGGTQGGTVPELKVESEGEQFTMTESEEARIVADWSERWGIDLAAQMRVAAGSGVAETYDEDRLKLRSWQMPYGYGAVRTFPQLLEAIGVAGHPIFDQREELLHYIWLPVAQRMPVPIRRKVIELLGSSDDASNNDGDSAVQTGAEVVMADWLSRELGAKLAPRRITLAGGSWISVDFYSRDPLIVGEAFAHQGPVKGGQKRKIMTDAIKLLAVRRIIGEESRAILLFADTEAAAAFRGRSWHAAVLVETRIEVLVAEIPDDLRLAVQDAQQRQFR